VEAQPIYRTNEFVQAEAACAELRAHAIKCDAVESQSIAAMTGQLGPPYIGVPAGLGHTGQWDVIVAPEDVERATEVLRAWDSSSNNS
jgi:hypothetical protein